MQREQQKTTSSGGLSTRSVHAGEAERADGAPVVSPIVNSATFYNAPVPEGEVRYTRYGTNPTHLAVASKAAALEGAEAALVVASGMAAMAVTLLSIVGAGDRVVAARALYGQTAKLLTDELARLGVDVAFAGGEDEWAAALERGADAIVVEAISNPTLRVADLPGMARIAAAAGAALVVDSTFATPVNLRPLEHGADVVVHSATKYLGGHSDVIAGVIAGDASLIATARKRLKNFGPSLDPHAAWLLERGMKTLAVRVERQNRNALGLARRLAGHPAVERVVHPGLDTHPDHDRARELLDGYGGMLGLVVRGGDDAAVRVMRRFELVAVAPSLGGVETLASMPRYTSHAALDREERHAAGIDDGFIRISVGIEDLPDLVADLDRALGPEAP